MFPERKLNTPFLITIISGTKFVFGILLLTEQHWRYKLADNEKLNFEIRNIKGEIVVEQQYSASDTDPEDKIITIKLSEDETAKLIPGEKYFLVGVVDGFVVVPQTEIKVKSIIEGDDLY